MSTNVLGKDYEQLQESIAEFRKECFNQLENKTIVVDQEVPTSTPVIPQIQLNIDYVQFEQFATKLAALIEEKQPQLSEQLKKVLDLFNTETGEQLFKAAVEMNTTYFNQVSKEENIEEWVTPFIVENSVRPYLQKAANELEDKLANIKSPKQCPACGEPPRFAIIKKDGKKEINCPRCYHKWVEKKISCSHCGTENHEDIKILQIEEDNKGEVYACKNCNSYTKVIKTADMLVVPAADLLDIKSIHFDYVAQEKGFTPAAENHNTKH